jgi:hypothetical protein
MVQNMPEFINSISTHDGQLIINSFSNIINKTIFDWVEEFNDVDDVDESTDDLDEGKKSISKNLLKSIDKYHAAQLEFQKIQKEFILTPKDNIEKRNSIKVKLIKANKEAKAAEAEFQATLGKEESDDSEIIW